MMHNDTIEINEEKLNPLKVSIICQDLIIKSKTLWCFSLRKCSCEDIDFQRLVQALKKCKTIRYLNFNLNVINSFDRITYLATLLPSLKYLDTLCLHSSILGDEGLRILYYSLLNNEHLRSLDIGDCDLTDKSVPVIKELIRRKEHPIGLFELVISYNREITPIGWSQILIAIASAVDIKYFHMDYNNLDDSCGYLIAAILTSNRSLEVMDLESTGLTNKTATLLAYLVRNYRLTIKSLNLSNNNIDKSIVQEIQHFIENDNSFGNLQINQEDSDYLKESKNACGPSINNHFIITDTTGNNLNKTNDIKIRDQKIMDKYVKNGIDFNKQDKKLEAMVNDYERILERNYKEVKMNNNLHMKKEEVFHVVETKKAHIPGSVISDSSAKSSPRNSEDNDIELIEPTDDLRYKRHIVLPFNIE